MNLTIAGAILGGGLLLATGLTAAIYRGNAISAQARAEEATKRANGLQGALDEIQTNREAREASLAVLARETATRTAETIARRRQYDALPPTNCATTSPALQRFLDGMQRSPAAGTGGNPPVPATRSAGVPARAAGSADPVRR